MATQLGRLDTMKSLPGLLLAFTLAVFSDLISAGPAVAVVVAIAGGGTAWVGAPVGYVAGGFLGAIGIGVGTGVGTDEAGQRKASSSAKSVSLASLASVSSASLASFSHSRLVADLSKSEELALASMDAQMSAMTSYNSADPNKPFTFTTQTATLTGSKATTNLTTNVSRAVSAATNSSGWPIAPLGVPQYNLDDCIIDLRADLSSGANITFVQPDGEQAVLANNIPPRCMTLVGMLVPVSDYGPYPIPEGTASVRWQNVTDEQIDDLRAFFVQGSLS